MDVFYTLSLKFLLDKSSWSKNTKLRKSCKEILKFLKNEPSVQIHLQTNPDRFVKPFLLALKTNKNSLILKGLFGIQKMLEFQYFKNEGFYETFVNSVCSVFDPIQDDSIRISLLKVLLPMVMYLEIHGRVLREIIKTNFNIYLVTNDPIVQKTAKASLMQILNIIFKKVEIPLSRNLALPPPQPHGKKTRITDSQMIHIFVKRVLQNVIRRHGKFYSESHKDGVVIFNALCRISMKKINPKNSVELKNRILSLELIHSVLRHSGPVFRSSHPFIEDIKRILCISLLQNSVSSIPEVFQQALFIFKTLILFFNKPLKSEIALFFTNCFLPILESNYSSFEHKNLVLDVLKDIFSRSQIFFDLFINYDCWGEREKSGGGTKKKKDNLRIVERTIEMISHTVVTAPLHVKQNVLTAEQGRDIEQKAISILAKILRRLKNFIKDDQKSLRSSSNISISRSSTSSKAVPKRILKSPTDPRSPISPTDEDYQKEKARMKKRGRRSGITDGNISSQHKKEKEIESILQKKSETLDFNEGVKLFNLKPSKGIDYLVKIGRVRDDPMEIARFLMRKDMDIDQSQVGAFLANTNNETILHKFTQLVGLRGLTYLQAFRKYLTSFRIPGEGQQIDRILQKFAQVYMEQNPDVKVFKNADSAYFFAYASMWLHTDLHNPALKFHARMTIDDFRSVTAGKNEGENYDEAFLVMVYDDIKNNEIKIHGVNTKEEDEKKKLLLQQQQQQQQQNQRGKKRQDIFHQETVKIFHKTRREFGQEWKKRKGGSFLSQSSPTSSSPQQHQPQPKKKALPPTPTAVKSGSFKGKKVRKSGSGSFSRKKKSTTSSPTSSPPKKQKTSSLKKKKSSSTSPTSTPLQQKKKKKQQQQQGEQKEEEVEGEVADQIKFFYISTETDKVMIINPLFKILWKPTTKAIEDILKRTARNEDVIYLCLDTLQSGIYVSSRLGIDGALNKFSEILVSQTGLFNPSPKYHLNVKNVEAIRLVMKVVQKEYNHITTGWIHFLSAISKLDRIRMLGKKGSAPLNPYLPKSSASDHPPGSSADQNLSPRSRKTKRLSFLGGGKKRRSEGSGISRNSTGGSGSSSAKGAGGEAHQSVTRNHGLLFRPKSKKQQQQQQQQQQQLQKKKKHQQQQQQIQKMRKKKVRQEQGMLDESVLEYVFMNSTRLNDTSIVCFVSALCKLSSTELHVLKEPRDFCLKKLIDVSVYNIPQRSQAVWTSLWDVLSSHFISVSSHPNHNLAMLAIDALKQVAYHFFQKEEMKSFMFQSKFLLPFHEMMDRHSESLDDKIRLMIVDIVGNLIKSRASNIKSGWTTIFHILRAGSKDKNRSVLKSAFRYTKEMLEEETFDRIIGSNLEVGEEEEEEEKEKKQKSEEVEGEEEEEGEEEVEEKKKKKNEKRLKNHIQFFISYVDTIVSFGENTTDHEIGQRAIKLIERCSRKVTSEKIPGLERRDGKFRADRTSHLETWLKILFSLSTLTHDKHPMEIRIIALETVFKVLKENGGFFEEKLWEIVFKGSLRLLFDDIKQVDENGVESDWMKNTCHKSLVLLIDTFVLFYDSISFLFDEILNLIKMITRRESERLCYIGSNCLEKLIDEGGKNFSDLEWSKIVNLLSVLVKRMQFQKKEEKKEKEEENMDDRTVEMLIENQKLLFEVIDNLHQKYHCELDWNQHTKLILHIFEEEKESIQKVFGTRSTTKKKKKIGRKINSKFLEIHFLCSELKMDILFTSLFLGRKKGRKVVEEEEDIKVKIRQSPTKKNEISVVLNEDEENEEERSEIEKYFEDELVQFLKFFISKSEEFIEEEEEEDVNNEERKMVNKYMVRIIGKKIGSERIEQYRGYFKKYYDLFCETLITPDVQIRRELIRMMKIFGRREEV